MNKDDINSIISNLDEDLIKSAEEKRAAAHALAAAEADSEDGGKAKRSRIIKKTVTAVAAIAACAALTVGGVAWLRAVNSGIKVVGNNSDSAVTTPAAVTEEAVTGTPADCTTAALPDVTGENADTGLPSDCTTVSPPEVSGEVTTAPDGNSSAGQQSETGICSVPKKPDETAVTTNEKPSTKKIEKTTGKTQKTDKPETTKETAIDDDEVVIQENPDEYKPPVESPAVEAPLGDVPVGDLPSPTKVRTVSAAKYPKLATSPQVMPVIQDYTEVYAAWHSDWLERNEAIESLEGCGYSFYKSSCRELLMGSGSENLVYSPVNVYMALSMLAEITGGESREQLLELLGTSDIESLRQTAADMWRANYINDGAATSILANSVWLSDRVAYNESTLKTIAESYKASSYSGAMGSDEMDNALRNWLTEQTGGMLESFMSGIKLPEDTLMAMASTVYFKARWNAIRFRPENNEKRIFHSPSGELEREFMYTCLWPHTYYYSDDYGAVSLPFVDSGKMWFILPDEGKTPDDLLESGEFLDMVKDCESWDSIDYKLHLRIPKFNVSSELKLEDTLKALGVTDVFDRSQSDFSPLVNGSGIALGEVKHCARVTIDEQGCEAAAFTVFGPTTGAYKPPEYSEFEFTLDRPFIFVIDNGSGQPLFVGVVNEP